jgi:hypothetical protein
MSSFSNALIITLSLISTNSPLNTLMNSSYSMLPSYSLFLSKYSKILLHSSSFNYDFKSLIACLNSMNSILPFLFLSIFTNCFPICKILYLFLTINISLTNFNNSTTSLLFCILLKNYLCLSFSLLSLIPSGVCPLQNRILVNSSYYKLFDLSTS